MPKKTTFDLQSPCQMENPFPLDTTPFGVDTGFPHTGYSWGGYYADYIRDGCVFSPNDNPCMELNAAGTTPPYRTRYLALDGLTKRCTNEWVTSIIPTGVPWQSLTWGKPELFPNPAQGGPDPAIGYPINDYGHYNNPSFDDISVTLLDPLCKAVHGSHWNVYDGNGNLMSFTEVDLNSYFGITHTSGQLQQMHRWQEYYYKVVLGGSIGATFLPHPSITTVPLITSSPSDFPMAIAEPASWTSGRCVRLFRFFSFFNIRMQLIKIYTETFDGSGPPPPLTTPPDLSDPRFIGVCQTIYGDTSYLASTYINPPFGTYPGASVSIDIGCPSQYMEPVNGFNRTTNRHLPYTGVLHCNPNGTPLIPIALLAVMPNAQWQAGQCFVGDTVTSTGNPFPNNFLYTVTFTTNLESTNGQFNSPFNAVSGNYVCTEPWIDLGCPSNYIADPSNPEYCIPELLPFECASGSPSSDLTGVPTPYPPFITAGGTYCRDEGEVQIVTFAPSHHFRPKPLAIHFGSTATQIRPSGTLDYWRLDNETTNLLHQYSNDGGITYLPETPTVVPTSLPFVIAPDNLYYILDVIYLPKQSLFVFFIFNPNTSPTTWMAAVARRPINATLQDEWEITTFQEIGPGDSSSFSSELSPSGILYAYFYDDNENFVRYTCENPSWQSLIWD